MNTELSETPCGFFCPTDNGACSNCGHEEEAHAPSPTSIGGSVRAVSDGVNTSIVSMQRIDTALLPGFYTLRQSMTGMYFTRRAPFRLPGKIYGDPEPFADRVLAAHTRKGTGFGVLLSGTAGTGKTVTAKIICHKAVSQGTPVIVVEQPFSGPPMTQILTQIPNPCVIFIDEFEKVYKEGDPRNYFLGLLDGHSQSQHLYVLTSNEPEIGDYFISRPGRIRYHFKYDSLSPKVTDGIIDDTVPDPKVREELKALTRAYFGVSPDALMSIIEEVNMFGEPPAAFMDYFNVTPNTPDEFMARGMILLTMVNIPRGQEDSLQGPLLKFSEKLHKEFPEQTPILEGSKNIKSVITFGHSVRACLSQAAVIRDADWVTGPPRKPMDFVEVFARFLNSLPDRGESLVTTTLFKAEAHHCFRPFEFKEGSLEVDTNVRVINDKDPVDSWGTYEDVEWHPRDIKSVTYPGDKIRVENRNGSWLEFTPRRSVSRYLTKGGAL